MGQTVLEMKGIKKSFSGIYALSGIDFSLELGEVHALLGENGAGKSTLIKVLGGIHQPDCGTIKINGEEVKIHNVPEARERGIGIIHQEIVLVPYLTVAQNLFLGREITKGGKIDMEETVRKSQEMINALGVNLMAEELVENLTIAQQQMVEIVKAVSFNGKIIVMDEPTSSLSNEEVEQLFEIIANLKKKKVSIIYISHRMEELFRISDRVTVIRDGAYVGTKKTEETNPNELVAMMVGRDLQNFYVRDYNDLTNAKTALEVKSLTSEGVFENILEELGEMPLPPYITHKLEDKNRYQTVYAVHEGSAAAPTAGLHFTKELLKQIEDMGVKIAHVTLHVGLGTFRPVKVENVLDHHMHSEFYVVEESEAKKVNDTKAAGGRVICVGTTSCRTVESASTEDGILQAKTGWTDIFIYPGYRFKILDALITNFHLPESTLVMLVSALAGREHILNAYEEAIRERYRFFSFGDAMFIVNGQE